MNGHNTNIANSNEMRHCLYVSNSVADIIILHDSA